MSYLTLNYVISETFLPANHLAVA